MIIIIIFIIIFIICFKYTNDMLDFNHTASLIHLQNPNKTNILERINEKSPILIHNLIGQHINLDEYKLEKLNENNPGYILNDNGKNIVFSSFLIDEINQMSIMNNKNMLSHFNLQKSIDTINNCFIDKLSCNIDSRMSIMKGNYSINLSQNKHNSLIISQIQGESTIYIFNPKHKQEIINKENNEIKKWGIKINLKPGIILYLPPEWYYTIETDKLSSIVSSSFDNYFTILYNYLR